MINPHVLEDHFNDLWHFTDVDVVCPDEKSIMTYVSQFLQYFKSLPVAEEDMKVCDFFWLWTKPDQC